MTGRTIVDISMPITMRVITDPPMLRPTIRYADHREGAEQMLPYFAGLKTSDLPDGEGWAVEELTLSTHSGSHMDAPWHYHSTTDNGARRAPSIDEAPLHLFMRPGVKLDFRSMPDGHVVTAEDVEAELNRIGHALRPYDIVLMNTGAAAAYGTERYVNSGCGFGREATLYLTGCGVQVVGTDAWSWDAPFVYTSERFVQTRDPKIVWEGHKAGRETPYYQMEKLQNLESLPDRGFTVCCFPVKIEGASAGWVRAVAILERG